MEDEEDRHEELDHGCMRLAVSVVGVGLDLYLARLGASGRILRVESDDARTTTTKGDFKRERAMSRLTQGVCDKLSP